MGGEIKLNEKEKWAAHFSTVLKLAGYTDASKYLHVMAYGHHKPIEDYPIGLTSDNEKFIKIMEAIERARKEINSMPKKPISKKPFKPSLLEDMHSDNEQEKV